MNAHVNMISLVAEAMGEDMVSEVAFVGGCATGLLITDEFVKEQVRHTDDVDVIVHVVGGAGIHEFQERLMRRGFTHIMHEDAPICAMGLKELRVDFMPDTPEVYGFTNRWYGEALKTAIPYKLPNGIEINLVRPDYFLGTKFEAYKGRGNNDPLGSRDIEDILTLIDGRYELMEEIRQSPSVLLNYIIQEFSNIIKNHSFSYAVTSAASGDSGREDLIFGKIEEIIGRSS